MKNFIYTLLIVLSGLFFNACTIYDYGTYPVTESYENPHWAPDYYSGTRYYYIPDIETYYDLSRREFVYLYNGHWAYSPVLPTYYSDFYLDNCYVVVVSQNTYQPWMHHQYYVSHYPRYYYKDYYDRSNIPYVRGYNENSRSALYWKENERHHAREWNDEYIHNNRGFKYTSEDRKQQERWNNDGSRPYKSDGKSENGNYNTPAKKETSGTRTTDVNANERGTRTFQENKSETPAYKAADNNVNTPTPANKDSRRSVVDGKTDNAKEAAPVPPQTSTQRTNYYGKTIGQPVKVERRMQTPSGTVTNSSSPAKPAASSRTRTTNTNTSTPKRENTKSTESAPAPKIPTRRTN